LLTIGFVISALFLSIRTYAQNSLHEKAHSPAMDLVEAEGVMTEESGRGDPEMDAVAMYAEGLNVSYEEASRRFLMQDEFGKLAGKIEEAELTFGGAWIEHEPEFLLNLSFNVPQGKQILSKYLNEADLNQQVQVHQSLFSLEELRTIRAAMKDDLKNYVDREGESAPNIFTGLNHKRGQIMVSTEDPESIERLLMPNGELKSTIKEKLLDRLPHTAIERDLLNAIHIRYRKPVSPQTWPPEYHAGYYGNQCTSGLAVYNLNNSKKYVTTAAHCNDPFLTNGRATGSIVAEAPYPDSDVRVMDAESVPWTITNRIRSVSSGNLMEHIYAYRIRSQLTQGAYASRRGMNVPYALMQISDTQAGGTTLQGGQWINEVFVEAVLPTWIFNYSNTQIACEGDSGGPVFQVTSYPYALGIGIMSYGTCATGANALAGFAPVDIFPDGYVPLTH